MAQTQVSHLKSKSIRIDFEVTKDDQRRLPLEVAVSAFKALTGIDPYSSGCVVLVVSLAIAFDEECRQRRERRESSTEPSNRLPARRPKMSEGLKRTLAEAVRGLGGPTGAALFLLIHRLDRSKAFVTRVRDTSDEAFDAAAVLRNLVQRLSRIEIEVRAMPAREVTLTSRRDGVQIEFPPTISNDA